MDLALSLTVIGYFVPVIFEKCIDWIHKHWGSIDPDLRGALEKLEINMLSARTVILSIRGHTNDGLLELLKKLKEVAYEADDLLDELNYLRLKKQVEEDDNVDNHSSHPKLKKARKYITQELKNIGNHVFLKKKQGGNSEPSSSYPFGGDDKSKTVDMINKIAGQLEHITSEVRKNTKFLMNEKPTQNLMESSPSDHRVTTSLLRSEQNVLGREKERDEIIELLLNTPASPSAASFKNMIFVLPIVGIGGVGKTTLAQLVYNNEQVKRDFDVRMWVHVSNQFDVVRLTREMLEGLEVPKSNIPTSLNKMQELLEAKLSSKRFLLVLDDVWSSERGNWEKLSAPLGSGQPGCRILITTRLVTDVSIVDNEIHTMSPIELKGLLAKEYWSLFEKCAFGGEDVGNHHKLEEIGRQIVKKLSGSPLAAKTVGGLLRKNLDVDYWQRISESDIWKLKQDINDIMPALRLSYQYLPPHLQQCFAYCSMFSKGYRFDVDRLVPMWIAQGYVQYKTRDGNKRLMDIGREYFHELERMYFFEADKADEWRVHDLLHDLAEYVSTDECFRVDGSKKLKEIPSTVRHLSVRLDMIKVNVLKSLCNLRNLRTLIIEGDCEDRMATLEYLFNEVRRVRVLYLNTVFVNKDELPKKIGHLIHLRCMVARSVSILPHSCSQLYQLQFLENSNCENYVAIGKLTCLQKFAQYYVRKEEGNGIRQLKNLRELGGSLSLHNLENVASKIEAMEAQLKQKEHLLRLILWWDGTASGKVAEEVLEGLQPPPSIKILSIVEYPGVKSPTWVTRLTFLTTLFISHAALEDRELALFLQGLICLSNLSIDSCPKITTLPLLDGLDRPKPLTKLLIHMCPELMIIAGLQELVSLEFFYVVECPKLIMSMSTCSGVVLKDHTEEAASTLRVHELSIDDPALITVLLKTESLRYLHSLTIQHCKVTCLNIEEEIRSHLTSLKNLKFSFCFNLESLQPAYLKSLLSLEELNVGFCEKLQSLPLMPASLKTLTIKYCRSLPKERYQEGGHDWDNIAHVNKIIWD